MRVGESAAVGPSQPDGQVFEGRRPQPTQAERPKMPLDPLANFSFLHHPHRWDVAKVGEDFVVVPRLTLFRFQPGVNGVQQVKGEVGGNPDQGLTWFSRRGFREIDRNMTVKAWDRSVEGYSVEYTGHRGPVHLTAWQRPYLLGGMLILDHDDEGWHAWRHSLLTEKIVAQPDRVVLRALQITLTRAMQARQSNERSAGALGRAELFEAKLAAFDGGKSATSPTPKD